MGKTLFRNVQWNISIQNSFTALHKITNFSNSWIRAPQSITKTLPIFRTFIFLVLCLTDYWNTSDNKWVQNGRFNIFLKMVESPKFLATSDIKPLFFSLVYHLFFFCSLAHFKQLNTSKCVPMYFFSNQSILINNHIKKLILLPCHLKVKLARSVWSALDICKNKEIQCFNWILE